MKINPVTTVRLNNNLAKPKESQFNHANKSVYSNAGSQHIYFGFKVSPKMLEVWQDMASGASKSDRKKAFKDIPKYIIPENADVLPDLLEVLGKGFKEFQYLDNFRYEFVRVLERWGNDAASQNKILDKIEENIAKEARNDLYMNFIDITHSRKLKHLGQSLLQRIKHSPEDDKYNVISKMVVLKNVIDYDKLLSVPGFDVLKGYMDAKVPQAFSELYIFTTNPLTKKDAFKYVEDLFNDDKTRKGYIHLLSDYILEPFAQSKVLEMLKTAVADANYEVRQNAVESVIMSNYEQADSIQPQLLELIQTAFNKPHETITQYVETANALLAGAEAPRTAITNLKAPPKAGELKKMVDDYLKSQGEAIGFIEESNSSRSCGHMLTE